MHRKGQDCKYQYVTPKGIFGTFKQAAIAEGVTPGSFKKYFKNTELYKKEILTEDNCEYCKGLFYPKSPFQRFCTPECRHANQFKIVGWQSNNNKHCEICKDEFNFTDYHHGKTKVLDHCHTTLKYRGTICSNCNKSIGLMKDNVETFKEAIAYLEGSYDLKYTKVKNVKDPSRGTPCSAGLDLFIHEDFKETILNPGESILIPSGIKFRIPHSYALIAHSKSGVAVKKGLAVGACVIDEDYQGEVGIHLINISNKATTLKAGEKIVQLLLQRVSYADLVMVHSEEELFKNMDSKRGEGGFGSTGVS